jgi:hypothetical protein
LYIDQDYDGGGWILVFNNCRYTAGMNNLKWQDAMSSANYRWGGSNNTTNNNGRVHGHTTLDKFNCWIGMNYFVELTGRKTSGRIEIVQFMSDTNGTALSDTVNHRNGMTYYATGVNLTTGGWQGGGGGSVYAGADGNSGMYSYVVGGYALTTYDRDQDTNSGNCATYYNNNPYWYTSCWSGNIFAGGSYADGPYWVSSSLTYSRQYCGIYIK